MTPILPSFLIKKNLPKKLCKSQHSLGFFGDDEREIKIEEKPLAILTFWSAYGFAILPLDVP